MEDVQGPGLGSDGLTQEWRDGGHIHRRPGGGTLYRAGKSQVYTSL